MLKTVSQKRFDLFYKVVRQVTVSGKLKDISKAKEEIRKLGKAAVVNVGNEVVTAKNIRWFSRQSGYELEEMDIMHDMDEE